MSAWWSPGQYLSSGQKFADLHRAGVSIGDIASRFECTTWRVHKALEAVGYLGASIPERRAPRPPQRASERPAWSIPDEVTLSLARQGRAEIEAALKREQEIGS